MCDKIKNFINDIKNLNLKYKYGIYPAIKFIDTLDLFKHKFKVLATTISDFEFITIRLYYNMLYTQIEQTNITTLLKEFIRPLTENYIALDFIFNRKLQILGIVPVIFKDENYNVIKTKSIDAKILYYDCCELWIDMNKIQPSYPKRVKYIKSFTKRKLFMQQILQIYIKTLYSEINKYGKATYVYEYYLHDGLAFKHIPFNKLETFNLKTITNSKFYISLAGAYTPGKYIDIGYYDAIEGNKFNITNDSTVFVIGFGAGLDLIHSLKNAKDGYGVEINLFGIISTKVNLEISKLQNKATIVWGDMRQMVNNSIAIPEQFYGKITKLLWNIPYESIKPIRNPILFSDFFDNYSVLEWFIPYLYKNNAFAPKCEALLWKIVDNNDWIENAFKKYGFEILSYNDENICIIVFP